jgi:hypothetical protein
MAEVPEFSTQTQPTLQQLATYIVDELYDVKRLGRLGNVMQNAHAFGATTAKATEVAAVEDIAKDVDKFTDKVKSFGEGVAAWFMSLVVENAFEVNVDNVAIGKLGASAGRKVVAKALTDKMIEGLTGGSKSIEPSAQPAANYLNVVLSQVFEAWAVGEVAEIATAIIPFVDKVEHLADLGDKIVSAFGISDSSSRVLRPYIDNLVVEPLRRHIAQTYRPNLLSEATAVRQYLRGQWTRDELNLELGILGWDARRIEALIASNERFLGLADAEELSRGGGWTRDDVVQHLRDQGYSERIANAAVDADRRARLNAIWARVVSPALTAHADRIIPTGDFRNILVAAITDDEERGLYAHVGDILRELNVRRLSASEVRSAVKAGILAMADYRRWLADEGYRDDDALTLELLLRAELDADFQADKAREEAAAERAAAKAARDQVAKQRLADVEAERARRARGSIADLSRAVVRGLIPIARLEEVLAADYDADTVGILVGLVEDDRHRYLAQQQKADDARQAAARRAIDVGALETAVLEQVLAVDEFRARLEALDFAPDDIQILTATIAAKLADRLAAEAKRRDAVVKADAKKIDLSRFEQLVRRGVRTLAEYDALLQGLGYDDASRAALDQLLQLHIADDRAAEEARRAARDADAHKGVTLEQLRRAVVLGLQAPGDYEAFLVQNGFTSDAVAVLMGELADDVTQADAARRRRDAADAARAKPALPLATLARAARLGIVPMATYQQRLVDDGYSSDDVAIEMDLLTAEIADTQAARDRQAAADAAPATVGVSLSQLERGVRAGTATLEDYRARAIAIGLAADDVDTLTRIIGDEALTSQAARARRAELASTLETKNLALGPLEDQVRRGELSIDNYHAALVGAGVALDDAALLAGLLAASLAAG